MMAMMRLDCEMLWPSGSGPVVYEQPVPQRERQPLICSAAGRVIFLGCDQFIVSRAESMGQGTRVSTT